MDSRVQELLAQAGKKFKKRTNLLNLWQSIADNFYPERADFTEDHTDGEEFADHLFGSYPVLARRELGNLFGTMLRPRSLKWFSLHVADEEADKQQATRSYLEYMDGVQWRAMYDPIAQFVGATKSADHDFAAFGNTVIEVFLSQDRTHLVHKTHHLRDTAWSENSEGEIDTVYRQCTPTASQLVMDYPDKVSKDTKKLAESDPDATVNCCQIVVPTRNYKADPDKKGKIRPWTVFYIEKGSGDILEETSEDWFRYCIPRWHKVTGTPYARSPATEVVLPDARTFQSVIRTLREAGEMHVNPPMIGVLDALRSDVKMYPGGLTAVDIEYDGELKNVLAPLTQDARSMPIGFEIASALRDDIRLGFFLDKIKLPDVNARTMTAYEVSKRLEEHIRSASPLFEPIEDEYNARICNLDFEILKFYGAFGRPEDAPEELNGATVEFKIRSPLRDVQDQAKAGMFGDGLERILVPASQIDEAQMANVELTKSVRDSLTGLGWPASWLAPVEKVAEAQEAIAKQKEMAAGIESIRQGGEAGRAVGGAAEQIQAGMGDVNAAA